MAHGRIDLGDEMDRVRRDARIEEMATNEMLIRKMKSIEEVKEDVEVVIDTHFFNVFSKTKSSLFLKSRLEPTFD